MDLWGPFQLTLYNCESWSVAWKQMAITNSSS